MMSVICGIKLSDCEVKVHTCVTNGVASFCTRCSCIFQIETFYWNLMSYCCIKVSVNVGISFQLVSK